MRNIVGSILVLAFLLSLMFLPVSIKQILHSTQNISASSEYEIRLVKVDSVVADNATFQDGTETSAYYTVYSAALDRTLVMTDHEKSVLVGQEGEAANIPHLYEYMRAHHDSIAVWYHPTAELKYARLEDPVFSNDEDWMYLFVSIAGSLMAIIGTIVVVRYFARKKQTKKV